MISIDTKLLTSSPTGGDDVSVIGTILLWDVNGVYSHTLVSEIMFCNDSDANTGGKLMLRGPPMSAGSLCENGTDIRGGSVNEHILASIGGTLHRMLIINQDNFLPITYFKYLL